METAIFALFSVIVSVQSLSVSQHAINKRESNIAVLSTSNEAVLSDNRRVNAAGPTNGTSAIARGVAPSQSARSAEPIVVSVNQPVVTALPINTPTVPVAVVPFAVAVATAPPVITLANASGTALQGQVNTAQGLPAADSGLNAGTNLAAASQAATTAHNIAVINAIINSRPVAAPSLVITA